MRRATLFLAVIFLAVSARAQNAPEPVRYTLRFPAPQTHYVDVEASFPSTGAQYVEVMMPVWSPGSYLVREYARNVEEVTATTAAGDVVPVEKTRKNRWRFATRGASSMTFRYRVYGREMKVQTNFIDSEFAMINGVATFIAPVDRLHGPFEVVVELPKGWTQSLSSLAIIAPNRFRAVDYDDLVDSPIVAGNPAVHEFVLEGKPHYLVNIGDETFWDAARATRDVQRVVEEHRSLWGLLPYERYYFFNFIVDARGGLEHKNSTVLMTSRFQMRTRKSYIDWLDLVSHEQFHAWNVKRLRPAALGPFDYENENYTNSLWISEGFTDYYGALNVKRAGLMTADEYLERLSDTIKTLQTTPGRLVQPVAMSSYDAWIKSYRPDENTPNTAISYYTKGAIVAWLLDARIRRATNDAHSLDDVMRTAYERFSGPRGFTNEEFADVVREVGGAGVAAWLTRLVTTTEELDYTDALSVFGLEFVKTADVKSALAAAVATGSREPRDAKEPKAYLGATVRNEDGALVVSQVRRGTPAFAAGVNVEDEIIAIDEYRVLADGLDKRLDQYRPGETASLIVSRRGKLRSIPVTFTAEPPNLWKLRRIEKPAPAQTQRFNRWLTPHETMAEIHH